MPACRPLRFTLLNLVSAVCWAVILLILVAWLGPTYLPALGISGWWSALIPAGVILLVFRMVGRVEQNALEDPSRA